jgi:hypothetical protein
MSRVLIINVVNLFVADLTVEKLQIRIEVLENGGIIHVI